MSSQPGTDLPRSPAAGVDVGAARAALERALASAAFAPSAQSRAFLHYVGSETLAGRGDQLSERSVGRNALGRPELFDGRNDSLVRVQASRVRKALSTYYAEEGAAEPIRVVLAQGRYAVAFEPVDQADGDDGPVILVTLPTPWDDAAAGAAQAAGAALVHALSACPGITVVGPRHVAGDVLAEARARSTDVVLSGSVAVEGGSARLLLQLVETRRGATLWTAEEELPPGGATGRWALRAAAEVGDYAGAVLRHEVAQGAGGSASRLAKRAFFGFMQSQDLGDLQTASELVDSALGEGSTDPLLLSMGAGLSAIGGAYGMADDAGQALERAERLGREALGLDPTAGLAHQSLGVVALLREEPELVRHHARLAVQCLPNHPSTLASAASLLSAVRDWTGAADLLRHALDLTSLLPGPAWTILAIERLLADDDEAALVAASHIHAPGFPWGPLYRALAYDGLGRHERARQEMAAALEVEPRLRDDPAGFLEAIWAWDPEHRSSLLARFDRYWAAERA